MQSWLQSRATLLFAAVPRLHYESGSSEGFNRASTRNLSGHHGARKPGPEVVGLVSADRGSVAADPTIASAVLEGITKRGDTHRGRKRGRPETLTDRRRTELITHQSKGYLKLPLVATTVKCQQ